MTLLLRHYYVIITSLLHHYYGNNGAIITVIMGLLLPIITKSIMGNNESIITHYEPTQLADEKNASPCGRHFLAHGLSQLRKTRQRTNYLYLLCLL